VETRRRKLFSETLAFVVVLLAGLGGCTEVQSVLHPRSAAASTVATLWWVMLAMATLVSIGVFVLLAASLRRRSDAPYPPRPAAQNTDEEERFGRRWIVAGGVVLPAIVLAGLFLYGVSIMKALTPAAMRPSLEIEVVGRQWWWEVTYRGSEPHATFRSANELHIPVGRLVRVKLRSTDVIHSFWVPALAGKLDLVPGRENYLWLRADSAGMFRGQCAEFCGLQHAKMAFHVVAHPPGEFEQWFERERQAAAPPADSLAAAGLMLFEERGCALCHTVRGTRAAASAGPDLTHLGRRRSLGAGTLVNNRGNLAGWIADPQSAKPGNHMPRIPLTGEELLAITHYLEGLR
jgi:cytochrome c oxidase subunit II